MNLNYTNYNPFTGEPVYNPFLNSSSTRKKIASEKKNKVVSTTVTRKNDPVNVILADDDEDDRELFVEAMQESGIKVKLKVASDGMSLLKMLKKKDAILPDIIFLDLNMPNKSGKECLEEIRRNKDLNHIPIIIYSTSSSINDIEETYKGGANLYVAKPSSFKDLLSIARKVLSLNWDNYMPNASRKNFVYSNKTK